ncbi:MAG: type III secretion system chaperone [Gammaproteobacteria bacterium]|nr:type III secretion system chaperone [Gammaproteobacteria bacterium]MDE0282961.1 type III secretion system chaperone [Gammaproteobacteria bacterium]MDE0510700.1 type III secretion system chaperone [Gammaproteobacteria bacterium]
MKHNFDNLLSDLGAEIGIPELCADEANVCNLLFDEVAVSLELSEDGEALYISSLVGQVRQDGGAAQLAALLDANFLFSGTGGATFGVDKASGSIVLARSERLSGLGKPLFLSVLEEFVDLAEAWQKRLAQPFEMDEGQAEAPEAPQDYGARV